MIIPVAAKIAFSSFADHERLFPIWYHDQLRAHHGCAESDWKRFLEYCCQHRWPSWEYYLSFSNCSYQQCRHQVRQRRDLYHAVATSCVCLFRRARRSRVTAGRRTEKQSHASAASKRSPGLRRHLCKKSMSCSV